ncbi:MAG: FkbM family methyltransferase [Chryseolinea sp.]
MSYIINNLRFFVLKNILRRKFLKVIDQIYQLAFNVEIHDAMGRKIFKRGSLHPQHTSFLSKLPFQHNDVILDIGANIGWYSVVLKNNIKHNITIFAFEPEPKNFDLLKQNIHCNNMTGIHAINKAVAEQSGYATLFLYASKNSGRHSLLDVNPETKMSIEVETVNIETFLKSNNVDFDRIKLIKIDIEGYEGLALKGATTLLAKVPYMFLEYSPSLMLKVGQDPAHFIQWLSDFDFNFYKVEDDKISARTVQDLIALERTEDLFLVKKPLDTFGRR